MKSKKFGIGFTLIELMIVIVIIGILFTAILPIYVKSRYQAQLTGCQFNLRSIAASAEVYHTDKKAYPPDLLTDLRTEGYIRKIPTCPGGGNPYKALVSPERDHYTAYCNEGIHHLVLPNVDEGFPQYNPASGLTFK